MAPKGAMDKMSQSSPEDMKKGMEPWMEWAKKCGDKLVDLGKPLTNAHKISKSSHGPSDSSIAGYSIMQADKMDEIKSLIENHPHLDWVEGAEIEVHEMMPLPGM